MGVMGAGLRCLFANNAAAALRKRLRPLLVAAHTAARLARLDRHKTLHPLDRQVVLVQGDEEQDRMAGTRKNAEPSASTGTVPSTRASVNVPPRLIDSMPPEKSLISSRLYSASPLA